MDWLNAVDQGYRAEFRELFETHFGRFEARLAQQTAELRSEFDRKLHASEARLLRWMFGFWIGTVLTTAGALIALQRL